MSGSQLKRRGLIAGLGASLALMFAAAPAAANVYCVADAACMANGGADQPDLTTALGMAHSNAGDDTIRIGPGTFTDGPFAYSGGSGTVQLIGAGQGSTKLTMPAGGPQSLLYLADGNTVSDLTLELEDTMSSNDTGLLLYHASASNVTIDGADTSNATGVGLTGSSLTGATVLMPTDGASGSRGVFAQQSSSISDGHIAGFAAIVQSAPNESLTVTRTTITAGSTGVSSDGGTIDIDDSLIDLGSNAGTTALYPTNNNEGTNAITFNARHLTIVGGGSNSRGIFASADSGPIPGNGDIDDNTSQGETSTVTLADSVIDGPETAIVVEADRGETATVTTDYVNYTAPTIVNPNADGVGAPGTASLDETNSSSFAPGFVSATDFHLAPGSALLDAGNPASGGPTRDLDGAPRELDATPACTGNVARRDIGAYEYVAPPPPDCIAPQTTIVKHPKKRIKTRSAKFTFSSSEPESTFTCKLDKRAAKPCSGAIKYKRLRYGKHKVQIVATDAAANADPTPASYSFKVVKKKRHRRHR